MIRKRGNMSLVKWVGYPKSFNSWVENKGLIKLYHIKIPISTSCLDWSVCLYYTPIQDCYLYTTAGAVS